LKINALPQSTVRKHPPFVLKNNVPCASVRSGTRDLLRPRGVTPYLKDNGACCFRLYSVGIRILKNVHAKTDYQAP